jgi:phosphatidylserine/phosphatidylglycerophosphate/cardiolipin synthase-like enzyme
MHGNKVGVLQKANIPVAVFDGEMGEDGAIMHDKFMLFGDNMGNKALLCTGSANVTNAAYGRNHENVIVLDDQKICMRYDKEFAFLIKSARKMAKK